jgi:DNA-binding MarR family transcriptional regulator
VNKQIETPKLTLLAWRVFSVLEETDDPIVGRSPAFIAGNLATRYYIKESLNDAIQELLQAGYIERVNDVERFRLVPGREEVRA